MKRYKHSEFKGGWFIGDFEPSILRTPQFEVAVMTHKKGEEWPAHYHAKAEEFNLLLSGKMKVCSETIEEGDIFIIERHEVVDPVFLEDCKLVVIKVPSVPGDKYCLDV